MLLGDEGLAIVPVPLNKVQVPVPDAGVLPFNVVVFTHNTWSVPAFAVVGDDKTEITNVSIEGEQGGLEIVQSKIFCPQPKPEIVVIGLNALVNVQLPLTFDHIPVPTVGVFAASVVLVTEQSCWSLPAMAFVIEPACIITTVSLEEVQGELDIVHTKVFIPALKPVTVDVGLVALVIVPLPFSFVQTPFPVVGVLPFNKAVVAQAVWSVPALAVVGLSALVILTESADGVQLPFEMRHSNLFVPALSPVMVVFSRVESANIAVPDSTVHLPMPEVGVLPASVALVPHTTWSEPALAVVGAKLIVRLVVFAEPVVAGVLDTTRMR